LERLHFTREVRAKAVFHSHTGRPQTDKEARCALKLLTAVPGLEVVGVEADARLGYTCSPQAWQVTWEEGKRLMATHIQRAVDAGADTFTTLYHPCQRVLCHYEEEYPLKVEHYLTLVGRALGSEHEDRFKKYRLLGNVEATLKDASPCMQANGVSDREACAVIQKNFVEGRV